MAAGDYSNSVRKALQFKTDQIWNEERRNQEFVAEVGTINALRANQNANIAPVEGTKDRDNDNVEVSWLQTSGITGTEDGASTCSPTGTELESSKKTYTLSYDKQVATPLKVKRWGELRDNIMDADSQVAIGLLKMAKELDSQINLSAHARLVSFKGQNKMNTANTIPGFDVTTANTYIDESKWNEQLFTELMIMNQWNKFSNPFMIHGMNYLASSKDWAFDSRNDDERDKILKLTQFPHYFDAVTFVGQSVASNSYMIDANSVAFAHKAYHGNRMSPKADVTLFTYPSRNLPGVEYDVTLTTVCENSEDGKRETYSDTYQMRAKYDIFNAPTITTGNTGVLEIIKGSRP